MATFTIDDLVVQAKSSFCIWATRLVMAELLVAAPVAFANPVIFWVTNQIVSRLIRFLVDKGEFGIFVWNTKNVTSTQAADYRNAVAKVLELSQGPALVEEWEKAEREANEKFDSLVRFSA